MSPIEHVRKNILSISQAALAEIAGVTQATVSRWEAGELEPDRKQLGMIRRSILRRRLAWDDSWFFAVPRLNDSVTSEAAE